MTTAEIITIGTEILLGEILDTNAQYLARQLRNNGIDLYRKTTIGDNARRIAQAIKEALSRADIVLTTGGLGPTVDDATREGVALALGVELEYRPELWNQVCARFQRFGRKPTENNRRQAYLPAGAVAVENPVGTAPAFMVEKEGKSLICLPGVPSELSHIFEQKILPYLRSRFLTAEVIQTRVLHTAGIGESQIDHLINDLEQGQNPTVGLSAHPAQVDMRLTAKAASPQEAEKLLGELESEIRRRLGAFIYGRDEETLEHTVLKQLSDSGLSFCLVEANLQGRLYQRITHALQELNLQDQRFFLGGKTYPTPMLHEELIRACKAYNEESGADLALGVSLCYGNEVQEVQIALVRGTHEKSISLPYGGPPENAPLWAENQALNLLRLLPEPPSPMAGSSASSPQPIEHSDK